MRKKEVEMFLREIINSIEVVEYTSEGEKGNIYLDELVKKIIEEYSKKASREKLDELKEHCKKYFG